MINKEIELQIVNLIDNNDNITENEYLLNLFIFNGYNYK